jgi:glutamate formiminotransferase/formiminotetrahydrofolate cyclodeaminase
MVANLTVGKKGYEQAQEKMKEVAVRSQSLKDDLLRQVDEDTRAFNRVMDAFRLPKGSEQQIKEKEAAVERAVKEATLIPLGVLEKCPSLLELAKLAAQMGNRNSLSDAAVAGLAAEAAAGGAYNNVRINLPNIRDTVFIREVREKAESLQETVGRMGAELRDFVSKELERA